MDGLNLGGEAEDFFDKLSDDDAPPGPDEAEEEKPKAKKIKAKVTISNRVTLNERLLTGPKGLVKYLGYFKVTFYKNLHNKTTLFQIFNKIVEIFQNYQPFT
jgi:hypothetical protein